jgi:chaperonin GroES
MVIYFFQAANALKNFQPFFDRVLIERFAPETKTKGGIMIPEKAQGKVLEGTVVAVGPGQRTEEGTTIPMQLKVGERVLLPEYGGTKVVFDDKVRYREEFTKLTNKFRNTIFSVNTTLSGNSID